MKNSKVLSKTRIAAILSAIIIAFGIAATSVHAADTQDKTIEIASLSEIDTDVFDQALSTTSFEFRAPAF